MEREGRWGGKGVYIVFWALDQRAGLARGREGQKILGLFESGLGQSRERQGGMIRGVCLVSETTITLLSRIRRVCLVR